MAGYRLPSSSVSKTVEAESKGVLTVDESVTKMLIPVISNTILIKNCQAKVLGDTFTPWTEMSEEAFVRNVAYQECRSAQADVPDGSDNLTRIESEVIDLDYYFSTDSSSDEAEESENATRDTSALASTLRLLEEVHYHIFGEKTTAIPKIEKVETRYREMESDDEDEKIDEKVTGKEDEENEDITMNVEFMTYVKFAETFVDSIVQSAKEVCKYKHAKKIVSVSFTDKEKLRNIAWPTIERFSVEEGAYAIDKYIHRTFTLVEAWKYKITHLISQSDKASDFYFYDAKFCIPSYSYPIAQATVSIYFTVEVSRVVPRDVPVSVTFNVESLRTVMKPGEITIDDGMLLRVLYFKLAVYKKLVF